MVMELEEKFKLRKAEIFATIKTYVTEATYLFILLYQLQENYLDLISK